MTVNITLSIPNALRTERPDDYYKNTATIEWPDGADGQPLAIHTSHFAATVFKAGGHTPLAKEFVRFLVEDGWLAHWLDFSAERLLPPMPKLLQQPFWLDPSDPHRMAAALQFLSSPRSYSYSVASGDPRHLIVSGERVWGQGDPPRCRGRHHLRADGRRGHRADQANPERIVETHRVAAWAREELSGGAEVGSWLELLKKACCGLA
jgi:hypothetical protein